MDRNSTRSDSRLGSALLAVSLLAFASCGQEVGWQSDTVGIRGMAGSGDEADERPVVYRAPSKVHILEDYETFADGFSITQNFSADGLTYGTSSSINRVSSLDPISGTKSLHVGSAAGGALWATIDALQVDPTIKIESISYNLAVESGVMQASLGGYNLALIVNTTSQWVPWTTYYGLSIPPNTLLLRDGNLTILHSEPYATGTPITVEIEPGTDTLTINATALLGLGADVTQIGAFSISPLAGFAGGSLRLDDISVTSPGGGGSDKEKKPKKDKKPK